jgi:predicted transcriptional regulator of viral defense system
MGISKMSQVQTNAIGSYSRRLGVRLLDGLLVRGKRIFTVQEARDEAKGIGIRETTLPWILHELVSAGWIKRPRRGLYVVDETDRGGSSPHPFAIATALVVPSAISHWSALAYHGLTEQAPRIITASTPKDVVTPRMRQRVDRPDEPASIWEVDGLSIRYIRVKPEHFWGHDLVWVDEFSRVSITDRERTVLDGFISPEIFGSLHEVVGVLEEHLAEIDVSRLVDYALRFGQGATIKRLGYLLDRHSVSPEVLEPLREATINGYRLLDPQGPDEGPFDSSWKVRENLKA